MTIQLNSEQQRIITLAIQAGLIHDAEEAINVGLEAIRQRLESGRTSQYLSVERWLQEFHSWAHSHPTSSPLLSNDAISRDSIYGTP